MLAAVRTIAGAVELPVTADLEAGYGATAAEVGETIAGALEAGAVGCNLEDGTGDAEAPLRPPPSTRSAWPPRATPASAPACRS